MSGFDIAMAMEDILQEAGVFYNGIRGPGNPAAMDSYMTCIDYAKLEETWEKLGAKRSVEEWLAVAGYWDSVAYQSPNCRQLAAFIRRRVGKGVPEAIA